MLLLVASASLVARQAYRSFQYSLYYVFPHYLLMPPPIRDGTEWLPVQVAYFLVIWRSMASGGVTNVQSITALIVLVVFVHNFHLETSISDLPVIGMILQNPTCTEILLWGHCLFAYWVISSAPMQLWIMRWGARLERLDHKIWRMSRYIFNIFHIGVFHCSRSVASWVSLRCFELGAHGLICLVTSFAGCRLLLQSIAGKVSWWADAGLIAISVPISSILNIWWLKVALYLVEEDLILEEGKEYVYQPLRGPTHIRLLVVYPWIFGTVVRCNMVQISLDSSPIYEALSYTWGDNKQKERMIVNGHYQDIPANAYKAIIGVSSTFLPRVIWIDSVCINQSDRIERSKQVLLMERIYSQALEVTVWLGGYHFPEQGGEGLSSAFLGRYAPQFRNDYDDDMLLLLDAHMAVDLLRDFFFSKQFDERSLHRESLSTLMGARGGLRVHSWRALRRFLHHPWFERIWVVQEVSLAKNVRVLYGGEEMEWSMMVFGLGRMFHELQAEAAVLIAAPEKTPGTLTLPPALQNILGMKSMREKVQDNNKLTFPDALQACTFFKATDPRDRIFGIRSICSSLPSHLMDPDYTVPNNAVYINAAESLIIEKNFDHVFGFAGVGMVESSTSGIIGLPSWVPDWTTPSMCLPYALTSSGESYAAGRGLSPRIKFQAKSKLLLSGVFLATITKIGPLFVTSTTADEEPVLSQLRDLIHKYDETWRLVEQSHRTLESYPFTSPTQSLREVFWRSLVGDRGKGFYPAPPEVGHKFENALKYVRRFLDSPNAVAELPLAPDEDAQVQWYFQFAEFEEMTKGGIMGRRLCVTNEGYVGVCPPYSLVGDIICVVPGLRTPLLLRSISEANKKIPCYKHVGECYVHGFMQGEALADDSVLQKFVVT